MQVRWICWGYAVANSRLHTCTLSVLWIISNKIIFPGLAFLIPKLFFLASYFHFPYFQYTLLFLPAVLPPSFLPSVWSLHFYFTFNHSLFDAFPFICRPNFLTYITFFLLSKEFNVSYKAGLLATNALNFYFSKKVFISLLLLKNNFTEYRILGWYFISFNSLNISLQTFLACMFLRNWI